MAFHKALDLVGPLHILAFEAPKCGMNVCPETTHISVECQIGPRHLECVLADQWPGYVPKDQERVPKAPTQLNSSSPFLLHTSGKAMHGSRKPAQ